MNSTVSPYVYELIKNVSNHDIENSSISIHEPNKKGEGYLGKICFVSVTNKNTGKTLNIVIKEAFTDEFIRENAPIRNVFLNEINFYTKVWPCFERFQEEQKVLKYFDKIPKCLGTVSGFSSEKIVLENIKYQNFEVFDKTKSFDKEHVEYILTQYGKFHAISFAYRSLYPENYAELSKGLIDIHAGFLENSMFRDSIRLTFEFCLKSLCPGEDDEVIEKYKRYIEHGVEQFGKSNSYVGPYSVIVHGDCWSNNMMFKYDESKKLVDMRLIDFQIVKDGTPMNDLSYFLYSGASKEVLDDLDYYLKVYYKSLSKSLKEFGCNADELYPFAELKEQWKTHCQLGFTMGIMLWKMKLTYDEDVLDMTDFQENSEHVEAFLNAKYDEDTFRDISRHLILHMYKNDLL